MDESRMCARSEGINSEGFSVWAMTPAKGTPSVRSIVNKLTLLGFLLESLPTSWIIMPSTPNLKIVSASDA